MGQAYHPHRIIEFDGPDTWMPDLYHIYLKDQAIRGTEPPSKAGFRAWLVAMIGEDDEACDEVLAHWPPA
jgi:hypothetical protein